MSYQNTNSSNPNNGGMPTTLAGVVSTFKRNFLNNNIEIVPGLTYNQYDVIKRTYFYMHNQFESGPTDDEGNPKYFYDLMTNRNDQATKNLNIGTKDVYIKAETENAYLKSWLLRREFMGFAKTTGFGKKLNDISDMLPQMGTFVWKKVKNEDDQVDVAEVDLINLMNDPTVKYLKDGTVIERHILTQSQIKEKDKWDQGEVQKLIRSGHTVKRVNFLSESGYQNHLNFNIVDEYTPYYEIYEMWGEIPKYLYKKYETNKTIEVSYSDEYEPVETISSTYTYDASDPDANDSVYVMAIVAGVDDGQTECVMYCKEVDRSLFPYREVHMRRRKGCWLGVSNYQLCFPLIEKANELTNRFYQGLRIGSLHLYQSRDNTAVKNVLNDLRDGDLITSRSAIEPIATEIRAFTQYVDELTRIENQADKLCNSFEIVSGDTLPSGTPFKLGSQQLASANKLFEYIRENMGLFIEEVFNDWILPGFADSLTEEHILDLVDGIDDMEVYNTARRKIFQWEALKRYVLENNEMPSEEQMNLIASFAGDQIAKAPKQVSLQKGYYQNLKYGIKVVTTGENDPKAGNLETLTNIFQNLAANPVILQDPRLMKILMMIMESAGVSPLDLNLINQAPTNPSLNPANQGGDGSARLKQINSGARVPAPATVAA